MMFEIITSDYFLQRAKKILKKHPDLKLNFADLIKNLQEDPFQPNLKLHPLKGNLKGLYAVSLIFSYRVTLTLIFDNKCITLIDIGSHDEVY